MKPSRQIRIRYNDKKYIDENVIPRLAELYPAYAGRLSYAIVVSLLLSAYRGEIRL